MDRCTPLVVVLGALVACASGPTGRPAGRSLSKGALSYSAAIDGDLVVAAELRTRFELVAYGVKAGKETWRRDLGPADYDITAVALTDERVWVASMDGVVRSFSREDGTPRVAWATGASVTSLVITADRRLLVTASNRGVLCLRRISDGALLQCLIAHSRAITDLAAVGDTLASSAADGTVRLWALPSLRLLSKTKVSGAANAVALSPTGQVAIARDDRPLIRTPAIARAEEEGFPATDREAVIVLWKPGTAGTRVLAGHRAPITDLAWISDDELLSSSWDRTVRHWSVQLGSSRRLANFSYLVKSLAVSARGWVACVWARKGHEKATQVVVHTGPRAD